MVQIIENWSVIVGILVGIIAAPQGGDGRGAVRVQVDRVEPVAGFANLLADRVGDTLEIVVTAEQLASARDHVNQPVRIRARRGGPTRLFAHPDWRFGQDGAGAGSAPQ
jgi:hypothetical protein